MKTWTLRFRATDKDDFRELRQGLKTIETRAATKKYRAILPGDALLIICGKQKLRRKIVAVYHFKTIGAMAKKLNYKKVMPSVGSVEEMRQAYYSYPSYKEKIAKHGILAFELVKS